MGKSKDNENYNAARTIILSVIATVVFVCIITAYYKMLYNETRENIIRNGRVNAIESSDQINMRMSASMDILKLASYTLDNMIKENRSPEEMLDYLTTETVAVEDSLIADTTGIYGYILETYMDGSGWVPEEGYEPMQRPWYTEAVAGGGDIVIVDPYIDLETGKTMISIARILCDNKSVVSIDVSMSNLQSITQEHVANDRSYAEFIVNGKGQVIAHSNKLLVGKNINGHVDALTDAIFENLQSASDNNIYLKHNNRDYMVYIMPLENDWLCVSVIDATSDFGKLKRALFLTILMGIIVAGVLSFFIIRAERISRQAREATIRTERAMAASEAKTTFLSNMSHEIRTPINAILGMNEMIQREETDETILSYSDNIKNAGTTLLGIINDVLDFSKIEAGKIEIIPVDYDLTALIGNLVSMIKGRAEDKGLRIEVNIDSETPRLLHGDEIRLKQILTNILTNAVKYTEKGSITIDVGFEMIPMESDTMMLCASVTDTGIGIKEEDISKLFSKFDRIEEERNRKVEGTGLGMSITKRLLELMDSDLNVKSVYGEGSTFSFSVKQGVRSWDSVGNSDILTADAPGREERYKEKFTAPLARILVVDDNRVNLLVFENLLKQTLIKTDKAGDGFEGINMSRNAKYDILFIDHLMPDKDGIETLREIREQSGNPNVSTPAICLTANALSGARQQYIDAGFDDYLTKPIESDKLEEMLLMYLPSFKIGRPDSNSDGNSTAASAERIFKKMRAAASAMDCGRLEDAFDELGEAGTSVDGNLFDRLAKAVERYEYDEVVRLLDGTF